ncbi:MAG: hydantoinase/oxoprolinase family protein [Alphaproteobacteria bacterium]
MTRALAGVDVGGTFTDIALFDPTTGRIVLNKLLTTSTDPHRAILEGLRQLGTQAGNVIHGTTLVTNALIERKGAAVGLITTDGYRDVLEIGNELRYDTFDLQLTRPAPLVERQRRLPVKERIGADGTIVLPLDEDSVRRAVERLRAEGVNSIAVAFFNSFCNAAHELRAKDIVAELCPGLPVCTSAEIAPEVREYERFSTCVSNAYVAPIAARYVTELQQSLGVPLFVMLSDGGVTTARAASAQPITLIESGPAAGTIGAAYLARQAGWNDVIAFDMGGTTAKISLIQDGQPRRTHELEAARLHRFKKGSGLPLRVPSIELIEIGAGGGSIASTDSFGLLSVGPRSAGSAPGPACYDRGGDHPTVTDADLLRGFLSPGRFLGGHMPLNERRAHEAVARLGGELGLSPLETAAGIARVVDNNMATAARVHMAEVGTDPRRFRMVAFGGAGPVHAYAVAKLLDVREVIFPRGAGVASAIGMLVAPRSVEFTRSLMMSLEALDWDRVENTLRDLEARGRSVLREGGEADADITTEILADMRYNGQGFEVTVPIRSNLLARRAPSALRDAFDQAYRERFARSLEGIAAEVVSWRVRVVAPPPIDRILFDDGAPKRGDALIERRPVYFSGTAGSLDVPVLARAALDPGTAIEGPALIEEAETTVVIGPGASALVDAHGNVIMRLR